MPKQQGGWIGVDFDGTLAFYSGWEGRLVFGEPIPTMVERVKQWISEGYVVKIVTARISEDENPLEIVVALRNWCLDHIGHVLPITMSKDFQMIELWDDRAIQVLQNTGLPVKGSYSRVDQL